MKKSFYIFIRILVKFGLRIYFNKIEINGTENLPTGEFSAIYAPNHQGAFLDALIVGGFSKHPIYSLARASVFVRPYMWFLSALNMMPVYRMRDGYAKLSLNEAIFEACKEILHKQKSMLIFPEAQHHEEHYLHPLSKGVVRIALDAQDNYNRPIYIIPVGINYFRHFHPRHKLTLNYGTPLDVQNYLEAFRQNRAVTLNKLRSDLKEAIKNELIIPTSENYLERKNVFKRENESLDFQSIRSKAKVIPIEPEKNYPQLNIMAQPLMIFNLPFHLFNYYVMSRRVKEVEFIGSLKFAFGLLLFPIWLIFCFVLVSSLLSIKLGWCFLLLQIFSLLLRQQLLRYTH